MLTSLILSIALSQAAPTPDSIDTLIDKVTKLRTQRADLQKQEDDLLGKIKQQFGDLAKKIDSLGAAPIPPLPADKLAGDLTALYAAEASATKRVQALTLANIYRQAAKEANSPTYETCEELASMILTFIDGAEGLGKTGLPTIRGRVLAELKAVAPNLAAPLNDQLRQGINSVYTRAAVVLEGVAK